MKERLLLCSGSLLWLLVERRHGFSLRRYVRERLLLPLPMVNGAWNGEREGQHETRECHRHRHRHRSLLYVIGGLR